MLPEFLLCTGIASGCILSARILLHYFQLESYQFPGYFRTIRRNVLKSFSPGFILMILNIIVLFLILQVCPEKVSPWIVCPIGLVILTGAGFFIGRAFSEKKAKKAFVFTPRIKRLYAASFILISLILFAAFYTSRHSLVFRFPLSVFIFAFPVFLPFWIALSGLIAWPIEKLISEMYFRDAQRKLRERPDLIKIGITGSWGKTSVKFILGTLLEEKYHTLVTPASYNTPMGVTKVIRTKLEPGHRIFVSEMGARHVGDIKEMCRLVHPHIGILTSVGPQHLDTFKKLENVIKTKYELIDALPEDGEAFFSDDEGICRDLYNKTTLSRHLSGLNRDICDVWAEDISYSPDGSSFVLCTHDQRVSCSTMLLGELNIRNILLCSSVALHLGLSLDQICRGIRKIHPVEHRLQLIRHPGGPNVIDDAFNSNIIGAKQAFHVLKSFPPNRIIVTPGMVELGDKEYDMNYEFGCAMSDCCDTAILVGKKRSEAISAGLCDNGFPKNAIHIVSSLDEASSLLRIIARPGDTILFENDLPDHYSET